MLPFAALRRWLLTVPLALPLLVAPARAADEIPGGTLTLGDRVQGTLAPGTVHVFTFEATAGTKVTVRLKRTAGDALFALDLRGPDEEPLVDPLDTPSSLKAARIVKLALPATGVYSLRISDLIGVGGEYRLRTRGKVVKTLKQLVAVDGVNPATPVVIDSLGGSVIKKLVVTQVKPKGLFSVIGGLPAALEPDLAAIEPPGGGSLELDGLVSTSPSGKKLVAKQIDLPELGSYTIALAGAGGSVGFAKVVVRLGLPKASPATLVVP